MRSFFSSAIFFAENAYDEMQLLNKHFYFFLRPHFPAGNYFFSKQLPHQS